MFNRRQTLPWLLMLALLLTVLPAPRAAAAAATFPLRLEQLLPYGDMAHIGNLEPGGTVDRGLTELRIIFTKWLDEAASQGKVTVTNSLGEVQPWRSHVSSMIILYPNWALNRGETYTIRIEGGPDGIKGEGGQTLPEDLLIPLHVEQRPFVLTQINVWGDPSPSEPVTDGGVIPRSATEVRLHFSRDLGRGLEVPGNVTVTDSSGQPVAWRPGLSTGNIIYFYIPRDNGHLPKNETYTIRIKGGMNGLLSMAGVPLPADVVVTLRTDDKAYPIGATFTTNASRHDVVQTEIYRVQAAAGPLTISLDGWPDDGEVNVVLEDPQTPEILLDKYFSRYGDSYATVELPRSGSYRLVLSPNWAAQVSLRGMDLEMAKETPAMRLAQGEPFQTRNGRFAFAPELLNPAETASVKLYLNDEILQENALTAEGTITPVTLDPRQMEDGIYSVGAVAAAKGSANRSVVEETFLVDRVDSFADVPASHWARRPVEVMYHLEILSGRGAGRFAPDQPVRRAEFAKILALTLGLKATGFTPAPFADLRDDWARPYIEALYEEGLIMGEVAGGQTYFYPDRTISRAEASAIVGRVLGIADEVVPANVEPFTDRGEIPSWARPSVVILADAGWINGFPDGRFQPGATLNRDQAAKLLANFLGM
ncbi:MAG TPA: S-layer homology domain-containing protein [Symbiobacteriaceae bacterium]|nr:S-layer homology domain-containing protein [Symbiobacteriaceae bacterium]